MFAKVNELKHAIVDLVPSRCAVKDFTSVTSYFTGIIIM